MKFGGIAKDRVGVVDAVRKISAFQLQPQSLQFDPGSVKF